jgi:hypothetical protein
MGDSENLINDISNRLCCTHSRLEVIDIATTVVIKSSLTWIFVLKGKMELFLSGIRMNNLFRHNLSMVDIHNISNKEA